MADTSKRGLAHAGIGEDVTTPINTEVKLGTLAETSKNTIFNILELSDLDKEEED